MKKTIKVILISILCIVVVYVAIFLVASAPGSTKKMVDIANQFKPDAAWQFESETIHPPRIACLGGHCDEMSRSWKLSKNITTDEFLQVLKNSGWSDFTGDTVCDAHSNISGSGETLCNVSGTRDSYYIDVYAMGDYHDTSKAKIILHIRSLNSIQ